LIVVAKKSRAQMYHRNPAMGLEAREADSIGERCGADGMLTILYHSAC
jgi:hypothetical protein